MEQVKIATTVGVLLIICLGINFFAMAQLAYVLLTGD